MLYISLFELAARFLVRYRMEMLGNRWSLFNSHFWFRYQLIASEVSNADSVSSAKATVDEQQEKTKHIFFKNDF